MPVETSMYNLKNMTNPVENYDKAYKGEISNQEQALSLKNLAMDSKTKEQGFQDQQVMRKAMQQNVDPTTGNFDLDNAFIEVAKQNPMLARNMKMTVQKYGIDGAAQYAERMNKFWANTTPQTFLQDKQKLISEGYDEAKGLRDALLPSDKIKGLQNSSTAAQQMSLIQSQTQRDYDLAKSMVEHSGRVPFMKSYDQYGMPIEQEQQPGIVPKGKNTVFNVPPNAFGLKPGDIIPTSNFDRKAADAAAGELNSRAAGPDYTTAKNNLLAVKNAQSLINEKSDPNEITNSMIPLLAAEAAKVTSGKAPTETELKEMTPQNRNAATAKMLSWITGQPEAANQGEFVEQMNNYLEDLKKNSVEVMQGHHNAAAARGNTYGWSKETEAKFKAANEKLIRDLSETKKHGQKSSGIPSGNVKVIGPNGQVGHIPRSQLQDALKQGFKENK